MADNPQSEWITVTEYSKRTGRSVRSIYRSIDRGTIQSKKPGEGQKGAWMVLYDAPPDGTTQPTNTPPNHAPDPVPEQAPNDVPDHGQTEIEKTYSQDYVDLLKATIMELKADKEYLKEQLTKALEAPENVPDPVPTEDQNAGDHAPDPVPEDTSTAPSEAPEEETPVSMAAMIPGPAAPEKVNFFRYLLNYPKYRKGEL